MKTVAVIQARMNSRRFPGKVLADLCGKPVLQHVVDRVGQAKLVDEVTIAVPDGDWEIINFGVHTQTSVHMLCPGRREDVLHRVSSIAKQCDAYRVVRVCADNPLVSPKLIDHLVAIAKKTEADYVGFEFPPGEPAIARPNGYVAEVVKLSALERADRDMHPSSPDREHVTKFIYENPGYFSLCWEPLPGPFRSLPPASIDTPEDLERVAGIIRDEKRKPPLGVFAQERGGILAFPRTLSRDDFIRLTECTREGESLRQGMREICSVKPSQVKG